VLVNIDGDASGNETNTLLIDRSDYAPTDSAETVVTRIEGQLKGFSAILSFEADTDLPFAQLPADDQFCYDWRTAGGISSNKAGAGANGDILITTSGLDAGADDAATFTIYMTKQ
jgi:hypothetical protein